MKRTLATGFFSSGDHQFQSGRACQLIRQVQRRHDESRHAAFHVAGSAPVKFALLRIGGERIRLPLRRSERNGIDMAGEAQRRFVGSTANGRHEARALR